MISSPLLFLMNGLGLFYFSGKTPKFLPKLVLIILGLLNSWKFLECIFYAIKH